jgi:glycosyltransferase 2 family protein
LVGARIDDPCAPLCAGGPATFSMSLFASRRLLPLQIALWLIPLAGVAWWASTQRAPSLPDTASGGFELVAALAVYALATLARSERWHYILIEEGVPAKRADTHALVPVGYMGNNALPARSGEILRVYLLGARTGASKRTILGTVLVERALDALALGLLLVALAFSLSAKLPHSPAILVAAGAIVVLSLAACVFVLRNARLRHRASALLKPLLRPGKQLLSLRGFGLFLFSIAIWSLEAGVYVLIGRSVGIPLNLHTGLSIVAFTNLCALVPAAPGYIGTYDAAVIFALKALTTVGKGAATSYLLLLRFVLFVPITIVGLVILFARYGGLRGLRAARADSERARDRDTAPARSGTAPPEPIPAPVGTRTEVAV